MKKRTHKRAVGIIIKDDKLLVFKRFKDGEWYYAFAGGGVEEGETEGEAVVREMKEELSIDVKVDKLLFKQFVTRNRRDEGRNHYFFLITEFSGEPKLSGPEKKRSNENNQYYPTWIPLDKVGELKDLYPTEAKEKVLELINDGKK